MRTFLIELALAVTIAIVIFTTCNAITGLVSEVDSTRAQVEYLEEALGDIDDDFDSFQAAAVETDSLLGVALEKLEQELNDRTEGLSARIARFEVCDAFSITGSSYNCLTLDEEGDVVR